jgi:fatty-acyl-CoA synthase
MSASEPPRNLAEMVRMRAASRGDAVAYEFEGRRTSFSEFWAGKDRQVN